MSPAEAKALRKIGEAELRRLIPLFGLQNWTIYFSLRDKITEECEPDSFIAGRTNVNPHLYSATITMSAIIFNTNSLAYDPVQYFKDTILHEFFHIVFSKHFQDIHSLITADINEETLQGKMILEMLMDREELMIRDLVEMVRHGT